jgi:hypothetical protein
MNWKPLRSELSVQDVAHEYMEFALKYLSPTYIHFSAETFNRAMRGESVGNGSVGIFEMIRPIITAGVADYHRQLK